MSEIPSPNKTLQLEMTQAWHKQNLDLRFGHCTDNYKEEGVAAPSSSFMFEIYTNFDIYTKKEGTGY